MAYRKSYEVVGWSYNGALYCVDHEPEPPTEAAGCICGPSMRSVQCVAHGAAQGVTVISATGVSQGFLDGNSIIDAPQPVFLDQVTQHDVCDLCFIPLDA